ncbi:MAG: hypothetical protein A3H32_08140 [Betaproteobacteria bacterium RIFCSPLOWO2_02_FULL_63_19]|nr:MAG: hypothetical protein A3H32_08140 [Betaproteobacteria bacterium RIFCSPLOWO2_02_FULL_63_19]
MIGSLTRLEAAPHAAVTVAWQTRDGLSIRFVRQRTNRQRRFFVGRRLSYVETKSANCLGPIPGAVLTLRVDPSMSLCYMLAGNPDQ